MLQLFPLHPRLVHFPIALLLTGSLVGLVEGALGHRGIKIRQGKGSYQRAETLVFQGHFHSQWQWNIRAAARGQSGHDLIGWPLRPQAPVQMV